MKPLSPLFSSKPYSVLNPFFKVLDWSWINLGAVTISSPDPFHMLWRWWRKSFKMLCLMKSVYQPTHYSVQTPGMKSVQYNSWGFPSLEMEIKPRPKSTTKMAIKNNGFMHNVNHNIYIFFSQLWKTWKQRTSLIANLKEKTNVGWCPWETTNVTPPWSCVPRIIPFELRNQTLKSSPLNTYRRTQLYRFFILFNLVILFIHQVNCTDSLWKQHF